MSKSHHVPKLHFDAKNSGDTFNTDIMHGIVSPYKLQYKYSFNLCKTKI
jgi:hypothetical protein